MTKAMMTAFAAAALAMTINGAFAATPIPSSKSRRHQLQGLCRWRRQSGEKPARGQDTCTPKKK